MKNFKHFFTEDFPSVKTGKFIACLETTLHLSTKLNHTHFPKLFNIAWSWNLLWANPNTHEVYQLSSGVLRTLTNDYDVHYLHPSEADI